MSTSTTSTSSTASTTLLLIDKSGTMKEIQVKMADFANLYKKAGFSTAEHFQEHHIWEVSTEQSKYAISVWGKKKGKNAKNVYPFPPPLDEAGCFCGNVVLLNHKGQQNLTLKEWHLIYDLLCDQAVLPDDDDLDEDSDEEMEDDYELVEGDDEGDEDIESEEIEEDAYVAPKQKKKGKHNSASLEPDFMYPTTLLESTMDCSAELLPDEYV